MLRLRVFASTIRTEARVLPGLLRLPPRVAWFHLRARIHARRTGDVFSLLSASPPPKLATLLEVSNGRDTVAELGTATGWTAASLALASANRQVYTYDPVDRPAREAYLQLAGTNARSRVRYHRVAGATDPRCVDVLYIDSTHGKQDTIDEFNAWSKHLEPSAVVVFDDYTHVEYPGVKEAVAALELSGIERKGLFVHTIGFQSEAGPSA